MFDLICPVCGGVLRREAAADRCDKGHSFDRARSGYVNLLRPSGRGRHGDDKAMVAARERFLARGFYEPLAQAVAAFALETPGNPVRLVDAGCGEGTYTQAVYKAFADAGRPVDAVGIDISKDALARAARRFPHIRFAVASAAALPVSPQGVDLLLNLFAPFSAQEFYRVLRPTGRLIRAVPLERHLWELKDLIYDQPYENKVTPPDEAGFRVVDRREIRYRISLHGEEIMDLFLMTPYYYKTGAADQQRARQAEHLETAVEFGVTVYERMEAH